MSQNGSLQATQGGHMRGIQSSVGMEYVFTHEIQQMMYGCGDCKRPLVETAQLVENIIRQQTSVLLRRCHDCAEKREAKDIGVEDCLFVIRHRKVRLQRFLTFMGHKDEGSGSGEGTSKRRRRRQVCEEFVRSVDASGELLQLLSDDPGPSDELHMRRLQRAEIRSRNMDPDEYIEFCKARQMNFTHHFRRHRFAEWIESLCRGLSLKPGAAALEALGFLAYETLAELIDMSLLVRHEADSLLQPEALTRGMPPVVCNYPNIQPQGLQTMSLPSPLDTSAPEPRSSEPKSEAAATDASFAASKKHKKKKKSSSSSRRLSQMSLDLSAAALTPAHVTEAFRRSMRPTGPSCVGGKPSCDVISSRLLIA